jgi:hypothetical protein
MRMNAGCADALNFLFFGLLGHNGWLLGSGSGFLLSLLCLGALWRGFGDFNGFLLTLAAKLEAFAFCDFAELLTHEIYEW